MTKTISFECYADLDLVSFLRTKAKFNLRPNHSYGQGKVVDSVFVRRSSEIGIVDEDPGATHHRARDSAPVVHETDNLQLRRSGDRHLVVVKPNLELCFLRSARQIAFRSRLPEDFSELHAALNVDRSSKHEIFRQELAGLYDASRERNASSLLTDLVDALKPLV